MEQQMRGRWGATTAGGKQEHVTREGEPCETTFAQSSKRRRQQHNRPISMRGAPRGQGHRDWTLSVAWSETPCGYAQARASTNRASRQPSGGCDAKWIGRDDLHWITSQQ
ncbi:hypothetical protein BRADI_4g05246v3 [Brachypodium distachyon]|uniref:Uncharacterized protein n=1 Tax=Brachypodium distachyon TaxID=15368 RepID=A0A2K2CKL4_BRADI|nr:hypothetical protein BRADI_4g05246v3 [Brachypodium distachyon]